MEVITEETIKDTIEETVEDNQAITAANLPLAVREHLMRGQYDGAVSVLEAEHDMTRETAEQMIEDYREALRERKIALEVQVALQQEKEANGTKWIWATLGLYLLLMLSCAVMV